MNAAADTIAAVATPPGAGGVGIVRVSGANAGAIAAVFLGKPPTPRHAHYCAFRDTAGDVLDRGLLLWFPAPHSFTGEDVLELHAHGSPVMLRVLLARIIELGARAARPGEFSERAFLNGKFDLAQAEAIADLIASGSESAARAALRSLDGEFSARVHALTAATIRLRSYIEAAIDFPDEDIDFLGAPQVLADLDRLRTQLADLLAGARRGVRLVDGLHVVIVGAPNVGKSSLLNALARSDRAIVTEIAGTTRDVLRETIDLDGIALTLVDTAGLRESADTVEREGIRRARAELERADLAVVVVDDRAGEPTPMPDELASGTARIVVHNKIDLAASRDAPARPASRASRLPPHPQAGARSCGSGGSRNAFHSSQARTEIRDGVPHIWLSARTRDGLERLVAELRRHAGDSGDGAFSARARHVTALRRAETHLDSTAHALTHLRAGELAAEELRDVQRALDEITGQFTPDDLLGAIFSTFCIGK
jgi:tRNA modification GTPase